MRRAAATCGWSDATGAGLHSIVTHAGSDSEPSWSPDGLSIAFTTDRYGGSDIVTVTPDGGGLRRLTRDAADDRQATWSSDGSTIAFVSNRTGTDAIWTMTSTGRGQAQLVPGGAGDHAPAYSPDGSRIAFRRGGDVWIANADGQAAARLAFAPTSEAVPSWQALPAPDVAISQAVQPTNATVGSPVTFTVSVTNRGTAAASSVVVTDRLPTMTTLISASPEAGSCTGSATLRCDLGALAISRSVSIVVALTVRSTGVLVNTATSATQPVDFRSADDRVDGKVTVAAGADGCTILGTNGDDTLAGTSGADVICGLAGDDVLAGANGSDRLLGGPGDDRIDGGAGDDVIVGGGGNDRIQGADGKDVIEGGDGRDTIDGGSGADRVDGGAGNDIIHAGHGDDVVDGGPGADVLEAGSGNDVVRGGAGADRMAGGSGDDTMAGGAGADRMDGENGRDHMRGGAGRDRLLGGAGVDRIRGDAGDDRIRGGESGDVLDGGAGNDTISGDGGRDSISGGPGDDRIDAADRTGDRVAGGPGRDSARTDPVDRTTSIEVRNPMSSRPHIRPLAHRCDGCARPGGAARGGRYRTVTLHASGQRRPARRSGQSCTSRLRFARADRPAVRSRASRAMIPGPSRGICCARVGPRGRRDHPLVSRVARGSEAGCRARCDRLHACACARRGPAGSATGQ